MLCDCGNHCWKPVKRGYVLLVSPEDECLLTKNWHISQDHKGYITVRCNDRDDQGKRFQRRLAREIVSPAFNRVADHKNRNTLDNRRENLREATFRQNAQNRSALRNSESGLKGVRRHKGKWRAQIAINGKPIRLGAFLTKEEAAEAYASAARVHFGEYCAVGA